MNTVDRSWLKSLQDQRSKEITWNIAVVAIIAWTAWHVQDWRWTVVFDSAPFLLKALGVSWLLALMSIGLGLLLAMPLAAGRVYGPIGVRHVCTGIIEVVRGIPELMAIFWAFFALPLFFNYNVTNWWAAVTALTILAAALLAEVIRGGLYSVPRAQIDAGIATGLSGFGVFRYVVLPQAIRNMVPAFIAQLVSIFKTTTLVYVIGVVDFFRATIQINNAFVAPFALYLTMGIVYFICCYSLSWVVRRLDPKYLLVE